MSNTVLVTGGGGFLGRRIAEMLRERGDTVRVLGRHRYPDLERAGIECVAGDVCDPAAVAAAVRGCDLVFHAAAKAGVWGDPAEYFASNTRGTENVVEACVRAGVTRLVHTSTPSVVFGSAGIDGGDEALPYPERYLAAYPASKAAAERKVLWANGRALDDRPGAGPRLLTCALRPHLIYGPGDPHLLPRVVALARAGRLRQVGDGTNRVDVTFVDHAARAHLQAAAALQGGAAAAGRAYFIGDAAPVVLWDWLRDLLGQVGVRLRPGRVPYCVASALGAILERLHGCFPRLGEPRMTRFVAAQLALPHWFSHARAEHDLGYRPETDPALALQRTAAWLKSGAVLA